MKKRKLYLVMVASLLINLLIGIYLLNRQKDSQKIDYNKIHVGAIIKEPNIATSVADIYFEKFLEDRNALDKRDEFTTTVMFDKDTCEWVVVYIPISEFPILALSSGPADYSYEVRLRMDHGMVRIEDYEFVKYLY